MTDHPPFAAADGSAMPVLPTIPATTRRRLMQSRLRRQAGTEPPDLTEDDNFVPRTGVFSAAGSP